MTMSKSAGIIEQTNQFGAHIYKPLPIVISDAEGVWVTDVEGERYMDMLSAYSALNQGHRHPRILDALVEQAGKVTLTSRAFHNEKLGELCELITNVTGLDRFIPMNSGAEAVETAIKSARQWGYRVKGIPQNQAEIIVCSENFHGRTISIISCSSEDDYRDGFGPFTPGFKIIPYGDSDALERAITKNTCAFLVEPIQGEAGVVVPPEGFLKKCREICDKKNVLFIADEVQVGFGRTGKMFCCQHEDIVPDGYILGKALSGGFMPISGFAATNEVLDLFKPGQHGSTFGGSPLASAVAIASIQVVVDEKLPERSAELGAYFMKELLAINSPHVKEIRGKGLFIGFELTPEAGSARPFCEKLMAKGLLCKETHDNIIRFAPPLVITKEELDWALERIKAVLA